VGTFRGRGFAPPAAHPSAREGCAAEPRKGRGKPSKAGGGDAEEESDAPSISAAEGTKTF